jgi:hypothetical protein
MAKWKTPDLPSSMTVTRRIRELRATDSLRKLSNAVLEYDGYLWRLGLRGLELDRKEFLSRLHSSRRAPEHVQRRVRDVEAIDDGDWHSGWQPVFLSSLVGADGDDVSPAVRAQHLAGTSLAWQRAALLLAPPPGYSAECPEPPVLACLREVMTLSTLMHGDGSALDVVAVVTKSEGRDIICGGREAVRLVREEIAELETKRVEWAAALAQAARKLVEECTPFIEQQ